MAVANDAEYDFFISHAGADAPSAEDLYEQLTARGARVFLAVRCLHPGDDFGHALPSAQRASRMTVVLVSSRTSKAWFQREEIYAAIKLAGDPQQCRRVVPVYLEGMLADWAAVPFGLQGLHGLFVSERMPLAEVARQLLALCAKVVDGVPALPRPSCLVLTRPMGAEPVLQEEIARAADEAGFQVRWQSDFVAGGGPPGLALEQAIEHSMVVAAIGGRMTHELQQALPSRPCLLVSLAGGRGAAGGFRQTRHANLTHLVYAGAPGELRLRLREWFKAALEQIAAWVYAAGAGASTTGVRIPADLFELPVDVCRGDPHGPGVQSSVEELFKYWLPEVDRGRRAVVTGLPGSGKSMLLTQYCRRLSASGLTHSKPASAAELPALPVVLQPAELERTFAADANLVSAAAAGERLWVAAVSKLVGAAVAGGVDLRGVLVPLRDHGRVHLVIDGFDEFASRNPGRLRAVLDGADQMARNGVNVTLACRENFWFAQVRDDPRFSMRVRLLEIGSEEAQRLLREIPLPPPARSANGEIAQWLRSPLLIRFLRELYQVGDPATLYAAVMNRTAVYHAWAKWVGRQAERLGLAAFAAVCTELALEFVEKRAFQLDMGLVLGVINRVHRQPALVASACLDALEVFERIGDAVRFQHETILEYFAAAGLSEDLRAVVATDDLDELARLRLASLPLDHFQSSVYGFFDELLDPGFRDDLVRRVSRARVTDYPPHLLRNLLEYLGLTARYGQQRELAMLLLSLIEDRTLPALIRFNAARALERIHPCAPRPYFEYVSDWGMTDFSRFRARQITTENAPWVIRGLKALAPELGRYVTFRAERPRTAADRRIPVRDLGPPPARTGTNGRHASCRRGIRSRERVAGLGPLVPPVPPRSSVRAPGVVPGTRP